MDFFTTLRRRTGAVPSHNPGAGNERNSSTGGPEFAGPVGTHRVDVTHTRFMGNSNDTLVVRDRGPWFHSSYYIGPGSGVVNWTEAGPSRPSLHLHRFNWRRVAGWSGQTREGMHTMIPSNNPQLQSGKQRMQRTSQNMLTVQRYRGQSYSQTTKVLG